MLLVIWILYCHLQRYKSQLTQLFADLSWDVDAVLCEFITLSWCYSKLLNTGNMRTSSMCLNILSCESLSVVGQKIKMTHAEVFPGSRALHESAAWVIMPMSTRKSSISLLVLPLCLLEWGEALSRASETHSLQHKAEHYIKIMVHNQCALIRGFIVTKAANNM